MKKTSSYISLEYLEKESVYVCDINVLYRLYKYCSLLT